MATVDDIGTPGAPLSEPPLTEWQAAVRDAVHRGAGALSLLAAHQSETDAASPYLIRVYEGITDANGEWWMPWPAEFGGVRPAVAVSFISGNYAGMIQMIRNTDIDMIVKVHQAAGGAGNTAEIQAIATVPRA